MSGFQVHAFEWPEVNLFGSLNASIKEDGEKPALKMDGGIGIEWMNIEGIFGIGISDSNTWESPLLRYGAECSFTIPGIELDCGIMAGTLKTSGAITRLSSPTLSAGTALHSSPRGSGGISCALPSFNSSASPLAAAVNFGLTMGPGEIQVEGMANMEKEWASSLCYEFSTPWAKSFSVSLTAGSFVHSREAGTSWFSDRALYPKDNYMAAMIEAALKTGPFSTCTSAQIYQDPFGGIKCCFKTLDSLDFGKWSLHTGLFLCDSELISSSGSRSCVRTQFFINPELCLGPVKKRFRAGLLFYDSMKITSDALRLPYSLYTLRGDLSYSTPAFSVKGSGYWTFDQLDEENKIWANLNFSYKIGLLGAGTSLCAQFEDSGGEFSLTQKLTLANPFRLSARGKMTLTEKQGKIKNLKAEAALNTSFSVKNISVNLSAGINSMLLKK
ncbi:MAG: hypothetical protein J6S91_05830 [Treponema sp.]|nr:hypothetical protein [Treponema sp.]